MQRAAPAPGHQLLQSLFLALPGLPDVPQLRYMAALLIGAYASWLSETVRAGGPTELIAGSMRLLLSGERECQVLCLTRRSCATWRPCSSAPTHPGCRRQCLLEVLQSSSQAACACCYQVRDAAWLEFPLASPCLVSHSCATWRPCALAPMHPGGDSSCRPSRAHRRQHTPAAVR